VHNPSIKKEKSKDKHRKLFHYQVQKLLVKTLQKLLDDVTQKERAEQREKQLRITHI
jgi:hypothetical protein